MDFEPSRDARDVSARGEHGTVSRRRFLGTGAAATALVPLIEASASAAVLRAHPNGTVRHASKPSKKRKSAATGLPEPGPIYARHANPADVGILEAVSLLRARLISSAELTAACQRRIGARNGPVSFIGSPSSINAWVREYPTLAGQLAAAADTKLAQVRRRGAAVPLLCGVPVGYRRTAPVLEFGLLVAATSRAATAESRSLGPKRPVLGSAVRRAPFRECDRSARGRWMGSSRSRRPFV